MKKQDDLSVSGPGSPISLDKFIKNNHVPAKEFTLLVDGTGLGIHKDSDECMYITVEECQNQAIHYSQFMFNGTNVPAYLYRYLTYIFIDGSKEYKSDSELADDMQKGIITAESNDYKFVVNLIKWCGTNVESAQVIGLIQLISGSLSEASKANAGIRLYLEHPESHLHPKRCSRLMPMIVKIKEEYGINNTE